MASFYTIIHVWRRPLNWQDCLNRERKFLVLFSFLFSVFRLSFVVCCLLFVNTLERIVCCLSFVNTFKRTHPLFLSLSLVYLFIHTRTHEHTNSNIAYTNRVMARSLVLFREGEKETDLSRIQLNYKIIRSHQNKAAKSILYWMDG